MVWCCGRCGLLPVHNRILFGRPLVYYRPHGSATSVSIVIANVWLISTVAVGSALGEAARIVSSIFFNFLASSTAALVDELCVVVVELVLVQVVVYKWNISLVHYLILIAQ